jgi:hypothetical protein
MDSDKVVFVDTKNSDIHSYSCGNVCKVKVKVEP